jgi:hypothetical protein
LADPALSRAAVPPVHPAREAGALPPVPRPAPPPRPRVSRAPAPAPPPDPPRPPAVAIAAGLWLAACAAGALGVGTALLDSDALWSRLTDTARASDPTASAEVVDAGVRATVVLVLGIVVVLVAVSVVGTVLLLRRRSWARWLLLAIGLVGLVAADLAQGLVAGGADLDRMAFLAQAVLVVLGGVALFTRSARLWLRRSGS